MKVCCTICSDLFDEINSIVSTPCGHTFHDACLFQWLGQSKTCPSCRKHVTKKNICKLYFESANGTEELNPNKLQNEVEHLKAQIHLKESEKQKLLQVNEEIKAYVKIAEDNADNAKQKYLDLSTKMAAMKTQLKYMSKQNAEITWLREENSSLRKEIGLLNNVQTLLNGTQNEVEQMLKNCEGQGSSKQMATYCSLLKKELEYTVDIKKRLKTENEVLKKDLGCNLSKLREKCSEVEKLKLTIKHLEEENASLEEKINILMEKNGNRNLSGSYLTFESPPSEKSKRTRTTFDYRNDTNISICSESSQKKKLKINVISSVFNNRSTTHSASVKIATNPFKSKNENNDETEKENIRIGYNGLGGHSQYIEQSYLVTKIKEKKAKEKLLSKKNETLDNFVKVKVM
ncbi:E3 ubiquitin-protein ligase TRAIP-like [Centruroides sculpturatus]|uniref:E3 ubiquitin-protein ligase TRAIP-like n=1 Tax=Centruroides sculpturatus TaxID=218467 RepID=UPI000C6E1ED9|nr:E3 ubiquitin-protein ligase TRAIP-like [Centruroides sculpturatus]